MLEEDKLESDSMHILGRLVILFFFTTPNLFFHFVTIYRGYDKQPIGAFLSGLDHYQKLLIYVDWIETDEHKCEEGPFIDCIEDTLGYHPRFNFRRDTCSLTN